MRTSLGTINVGLELSAVAEELPNAEHDVELTTFRAKRAHSLEELGEGASRIAANKSNQKAALLARTDGEEAEN